MVASHFVEATDKEIDIIDSKKMHIFQIITYVIINIILVKTILFISGLVNITPCLREE